MFACLLAGCKSSVGIATSGAEITKTEEAFFAAVLDRSFHFNTFSARMTLDFSGENQEFSSRAQMRMIHNDRIQISILPVLGIEMMRIELSNDSIKILDRMNKRYVADNYNRLKRDMEIDVNFQNLQALLTNQLFVPGETQISAGHYRQFRVKANSRMAEFQHKGKSGTLYTFFAGSDENLVSTQIENEQQQQKFTWNYEHFQPVSGQSFPMKMTANLLSGNQIQGTATLTFSAPAINSPLTIDFNIPAGYSRVTLEQLIKSLQSK